MKSLDDLENLDLFYYDEADGIYQSEFMPYWTNQIRDDIETYYLKRPVYDDGTPVDLGDTIEGLEAPLEEIIFNRHSTVLVDKYGNSILANSPVAHIDNQTEINNDAKALIHLLCDSDDENIEKYENAIMNLLNRQQNLDAFDGLR